MLTAIKNQNGSKSINFNWKLIDFNWISTSIFYQNPNFIIRIKLDRIWCPNLESLESKLSAIQFRTPNCLSLFYTSFNYANQWIIWKLFYFHPIFSFHLFVRHLSFWAVINHSLGLLHPIRRVSWHTARFEWRSLKEY